MKNHLISTFDYSIKEYEAIQELIKTRNDAGQEYYRSAQNLDAYKDKLLATNDPNKWEINFQEVKIAPDELAKNKLIAKSLMMPHQNAIMNEMKSIFGYFNHMMVKELSSFCNSRAKRYILSLNNFCSEQSEIIHVVGVDNASKRTSSRICGIVCQICTSNFQRFEGSQGKSRMKNQNSQSL